jgi:hypothetical protein
MSHIDLLAVSLIPRVSLDAALDAAVSTAPDTYDRRMAVRFQLRASNLRGIGGRHF